MNFLHYDLNLDPGDVVEVELDQEANVRLLDERNYASYREGRRHEYLGGLQKKSPGRLAAPGPGRWHLVIDLGGYPGSVRAAVRTLKTAA